MAKVVKSTETTVIYGIGKSKYLPKGKTKEVNTALATKLVEAGKASLKPVK